MANPHGFNLHGGMDFSPPQKLRRRTYSDRALPSIAALRQELAALRQDIEPMAKLLVSQSMMIEKLVGKDGMSA